MTFGNMCAACGAEVVADNPFAEAAHQAASVAMVAGHPELKVSIAVRYNCFCVVSAYTTVRESFAVSPQTDTT